MGTAARTVLSAIIIATLLGVGFFELTRISITGELASVFALFGVVVGWIGTSLFDRLSQYLKDNRATNMLAEKRTATSPSSRAEDAPATSEERPRP